MLRDTHAAEIDALLARYANRRSAVLPLLYIAQDEYGYLTNDAIREVAATLDLPYTDVFEVVGFYTLFYNRPVGKWMLQVCDDVPCCYLGAEELVEGLKQRLGIGEEETTADGMFTLQRVKCLAACDKAPLLQANIDYIYHATPDTIDAMLRDLRTRAERGEPLSVSGRLSEDYEAEADGLRLIPRNLGEIPGSGEADGPAEPQKAEAQQAASDPEQPAREAAEQQIEQESPVPPVSTIEPPAATERGEHGVQPARQMPQDVPPQASESVEETKSEPARGWRQQVPDKSSESSEQAAAEQPPAEGSPEPSRSTPEKQETEE
jgi:NADH-quinone oxidoreductase subunit E